MNARRQGLLIAALTAFVLAAPLAVRADDGHREHDNDHDLARELYEHGKIFALKDVLRELHRKVVGEVVAVDLVQVDAKWVYRFQVVAADGRRSVVDIDADAGAGALKEDSEP